MSFQVSLSRGLFAVIDDCDAEAVLSAGSWCARPSRNTHYAHRYTKRDDGRRTTVMMHTFLTHWPLVDHRNGDGLDNRRENLRPASVALNNANARRRKDNTSGFKGVTWIAHRGLWCARIRVDSRLRLLGCFEDPADAARAYDAAAIEAWGEFARPNFPKEIS